MTNNVTTDVVMAFTPYKYYFYIIIAVSIALFVIWVYSLVTSIECNYVGRKED